MYLRDGTVQGVEYENYLHFDVYGDGHDCFECAREIAEHYAVIEENETPHADVQAGNKARTGWRISILWTA